MRSGTFAALAALLMAGPAFAEDCGPLKQMASVELVPGPGALMTVPVSINNVPQKMLLSTAGGFTTLTATAVDALKLHALDGSRVRLLDRAGNASRKYVYVEDFRMGSLEAKDIPFLVTPNTQAGANGVFDGELASDLMARYDVELDFAARKMNYFSHDHCAGHVIYWPATTIAVVPFRTQGPMLPSVPGERMRIRNPLDTHVRVPVTIDGKNFQAVINTAAARSTMSANTAKFAFDITEASPGSVPLGTMGGDPNHKVFGHVFSSLTFEGITVANPHVVIIPDLIGSKDPDNGFTTGSRIMKVDDGIGPEVTIGMDVLKRLRLYIAYDERKLYITPATSPAPADNPPAPDAPKP